MNLSKTDKNFLLIFFWILSVVIAFLLGAVLVFASNRLGLELPSIIPQQNCNYNGATYKNGESFLDSDGCNACSCMNGEVACTLMYCFDDFPDNTLENPESSD